MKKILTIIAAIVLLAPLGALAAGSSASATVARIDEQLYKATVTWVADDGDGSVPTAGIVSPKNGYVILGITDPGSTAPQAAYDITVTDSLGADVFGGNLGDLSATATERAFPADAGGNEGAQFVQAGESLTFTLTNNNVNDATGSLVLYFVTW